MEFSVQLFIIHFIYELKWGGHFLPTWRQWLKWLRHGVALNVTGGEFLVMSRFDYAHGVFISIVHNSFIIYELKWGGHMLPTWRQWSKKLRHSVALTRNRRRVSRNV
jgi:hypothetical protein